MAAQVRVQVPSSVASWSTRPAPFSSRKHGGNVKFSVGNTIAGKVKLEFFANNILVYTEDPVPLGRVWQTTILSTTGESDYLGLKVGVITALPGRVPYDLPDSDAGPHEWYYLGRTLYHNKQSREFPGVPSLDHLTSGQRVGLLVTTDGQVHLFLDGQHIKKIATGLPVDTPLWGAVSVGYNCTKIKSEILSDTQSIRRGLPDNEPPQLVRRGPPDNEPPQLVRRVPPDSQSKKKSSNKKQTAAEPASPTTGRPPDLPQLLLLKIPQEVGTKYKTFGTFLLNDKRGNLVDNIKKACLGEPEDIVTKILQEWVGGRGAALTWDTLVKTLRDCELNALAHEVEISKLPRAR